MEMDLGHHEEKRQLDFVFLTKKRLRTKLTAAYRKPGHSNKGAKLFSIAGQWPWLWFGKFRVDRGRKCFARRALQPWNSFLQPLSLVIFITLLEEAIA